MLAAICLGFTIVGLSVWMPTYFVEIGQLGIGPAARLATLLPIAGIGGTLVLGWFVGRYLVGTEAQGLAGILTILANLFFTHPFILGGLVMNTLMHMLIGSVVFGASSLLLTTITLIMGGREEVSSTAGLVDFSFNLGAGLSGTVIGTILDTQPWNTVFFTMAVASLGAAIFIIIPVLRVRINLY